MKILLNVIFVIIKFLVGLLLSVSTTEKSDNLSDGLGNYIVNNEHLTEEEFEAFKSRGELYDTYL